MSYIVKWICIGIILLILLIFGLMTLSSIVRNSRTQLLPTMLSALWPNRVQGYGKFTVEVILFAVLVIAMKVVTSYLSGYAMISLTYPDASFGQNPNGTRYNVSEILSEEVLTRALQNDALAGLTVDQLQEGLSITPEGMGDSEAYVASQFDLSYSANKKSPIFPGQTIVRAVAESYRNYFLEKYGVNYDVLDIAFDDLDQYDYPDYQDYFTEKFYRITSFSDRISMSRDLSFPLRQERVFPHLIPRPGICTIIRSRI